MKIPKKIQLQISIIVYANVLAVVGDYMTHKLNWKNMPDHCKNFAKQWLLLQDRTLLDMDKEERVAYAEKIAYEIASHFIIWHIDNNEIKNKEL